MLNTDLNCHASPWRTHAQCSKEDTSMLLLIYWPKNNDHLNPDRKSNVQEENTPLEVTPTEVFLYSSTPTSQISSQTAMLSVSLWEEKKKIYRENVGFRHKHQSIKKLKRKSDIVASETIMLMSHEDLNTTELSRFFQTLHCHFMDHRNTEF